jgi:hypothetical protein
MAHPAWVGHFCLWCEISGPGTQTPIISMVRGCEGHPWPSSSATLRTPRLRAPRWIVPDNPFESLAADSSWSKRFVRFWVCRFSVAVRESWPGDSNPDHFYGSGLFVSSLRLTPPCRSGPSAFAEVQIRSLRICVRAVLGPGPPAIAGPHARPELV